MPLYSIDRHQPALHESSKEKSPCHIPTVGTKLTDEWSLKHPVCRPSTASSTGPNSLDYGLQVRSITASMCNSTVAHLWPPSASPNWLDYGLQVYLQGCSITACKFARSRPPSASLNLHNHSLQVNLENSMIMATKFARSQPPSAFPHSLGHGLGVYLRVHSIAIFRCTSNCSHAPPAASPDIPCVDG